MVPPQGSESVTARAEHARRGRRLGVEAWPGVDVADADFVAYVEERWPPPSAETSDDDLSRLRWSDLYLACGCARGDHSAIVAFEAAFGRDIDAAVRRVAGSSSAEDVG